ncbi:MAG: hypothetical protein ABI056_06290, partial [Caulobacteraceae bacterium]
LITGATYRVFNDQLNTARAQIHVAHEDSQSTIDAGIGTSALNLWAAHSDAVVQLKHADEATDKAYGVAKQEAATAAAGLVENNRAWVQVKTLYWKPQFDGE